MVGLCAKSDIFRTLLVTHPLVNEKMPDIFISYSRKDLELALRLVSFLTECGHSVWIDQSDIHAAALWSSEIVRAISGCSAFIVLISKNSVDSRNVVRELALASEKGKHILPIKLEQVEIPEAMEYQLAGIQRLPFGEEEALLHALTKLGLVSNSIASHAELKPGVRKSISPSRLTLIGLAFVIAITAGYLFLQSSNPPPTMRAATTPSTKTLMVLPFEDLSRTHSLGYFINGVLSELIYSFSSVEGIRIIDQSTSYSYRNSPQRISQIAKDLNVRYFIEGNIVSSGRRLRVRFQLIDSEKGMCLLNGEFEEADGQVFEIPEPIIRNVLAKCGVTLSDADNYRLATLHVPQFGDHASYDH